MESVLKTKNIIKKYGSRTVLNSINMNINKEDIYGFIGKKWSRKNNLYENGFIINKPR